MCSLNHPSLKNEKLWGSIIIGLLELESVTFQAWFDIVRSWLMVAWCSGIIIFGVPVFTCSCFYVSFGIFYVSFYFPTFCTDQNKQFECSVLMRRPICWKFTVRGAMKLDKLGFSRYAPCLHNLHVVVVVVVFYFKSRRIHYVQFCWDTFCKGCKPSKPHEIMCVS